MPNSLLNQLIEGWVGCASSDGPFLSLGANQVTSKMLDGRVPGQKTKPQSIRGLLEE